MIKTIDECFFQIQNGANIKQGDVDGGFPITRIETTANDKFNRDRMGYAGITDISKYESYVLEEGDLLMSHINSVQYLGRTVLYVKEADETIIHGMNLLRLKARRDVINPVYARYCFYGHSFRSKVGNITKKSVNQASFAVKDLKQIKIEVPSLSEQDQIVKVLDKLQNLIAMRNDELSALDDFIKARFVEMFGDPVSNTKGWKRVTIDECVDSIENGKSFVCDSMARIGEEPAILKLSAATYGVYKPEENKAIINESDFIEGAEVHSGDLLFTRKNTPELVGMAAYVFMTPKKLMMPDLIFRINTKQNCRKIYLWKLINHELFRSQIQNLASGSAKSMSNISKERLGKLHIYLPPLDLQIEFEKFVIQINKSKVAVQKALDETQLLFDSLMQKYFG